MDRTKDKKRREEMQAQHDRAFQTSVMAGTMTVAAASMAANAEREKHYRVYKRPPVTPEAQRELQDILDSISKRREVTGMENKALTKLKDVTQRQQMVEERRRAIKAEYEAALAELDQVDAELDEEYDEIVDEVYTPPRRNLSLSGYSGPSFG